MAALLRAAGIAVLINVLWAVLAAAGAGGDGAYAAAAAYFAALWLLCRRIDRLEYRNAYLRRRNRRLRNLPGTAGTDRDPFRK